MKNTFKIKAISSLEKVFLTDDFDSKKEINKISVFKNEKASFQILYQFSGEINHTPLGTLELKTEISDIISVNQVVSVPCNMPVNPAKVDDYYLKTEPGLYPDLIMPIHYNGRINFSATHLSALWVDIEVPEDYKAGNYTVIFAVFDGEGNLLGEASIEIEICSVVLPTYDFHHTEWLHCDCIAEHYNLEINSDKYFKAVENYVENAVNHCINTIMMPVITPSLDIYEGGERKCTQLIKIIKNGNKYDFDFSLVDRFVEICDRVGVKHLEIPPFFSQWGAKYAPVIFAFEDGVEKRIFGWDTPSGSPLYQDFLSQFLPSLLDYLKKKNRIDDCFFHISDEPELKDLDTYKKATQIVRKHLNGYTILDACWNVELFKENILSTPAVSVGVVDEFVDAGAKDFWVYYCGAHYTEVTNRYMSQPSARTRIIGVQMYKYDVKGFLHWGYNFYHNRWSNDVINPFLDTSGEYFMPSGDPFLVYPGENYAPYNSIRIKQLRDAMQDIYILKLCEKLCGRDYVLKLIDEGLEQPLDFKKYPHNDHYLTDLIARVRRAIIAKSESL